jgi:hypothetical protein
MWQIRRSIFRHIRNMTFVFLRHPRNLRGDKSDAADCADDADELEALVPVVDFQICR